MGVGTVATLLVVAAFVGLLGVLIRYAGVTYARRERRGLSVDSRSNH
ncbi:hypothetical protein [Salinadaptatus halalkaliphilus]|nr:hypothetical protein [Salinadaptatus halalkaliphilus]